MRRFCHMLVPHDGSLKCVLHCDLALRVLKGYSLFTGRVPCFLVTSKKVILLQGVYNATMRRHRCTIRGVAMFTRWVNSDLNGF